MKIKFKIFGMLCLFLFLNCTVEKSIASPSESGITIIRDAEIEEILTNITKKIFSVAGLNHTKPKMYVILSDSINAITTGNGYIFVTSGLLLKFKDPRQLIAVLSHETAHIAAKHIDKMMHRIQASSSNFFAAMLAGVIGGLLTGSEDALAVLLGYAMTEERLFLRFSREQEFAADSLGASYMEKMGYDTKFMTDVFEAFERMEIIGGASNLPVYVRTHPKSHERIAALMKRKTQIEIQSLKKNKQSELKISKQDLKLIESYKRVTTKLKSYIKSGDMIEIPQDDYPKAIYLHKKGRTRESIEILKNLVRKNPKDLYYKETLAQILTEYGKAEEAVKYYSQIYSSDLHALIKVDFAKALIQANRSDRAIKILESVKYEDTLNPEIFRLLAKAYGEKKKEGISCFMLAQEQMLLQNFSAAYELLNRSLKMLNPKNENSYIKKAKYFKELLERDKSREILIH